MNRGTPPWIFRILRERALSLSTEIEKETKRKQEKRKKCIVSGGMMAKDSPPPNHNLLYKEIYK